MASEEELGDDFITAALLFLDNPSGDTDSDSYSTPEPSPLPEPELFWHTTDAEFSSFADGFESFERPAKMLRTNAASKFVKPMLKITPSTSLVDSEEKDFKAAAPRRVNKRKKEIELLRVQAKALQARLDAINRQSLQCGDAQPTCGGVAWKTIANQQLEQRKLSEYQNRRLKELTSEHKRAAKALKRIAARQIKSKIWDPFRPAPGPPDGAFDDDCMLNDPEIFTTLLASLNQMLLQTDAMVFETSAQVLNTERYGDSHWTIKLQDSRIVPFGVEKTALAVWNYTLMNETGKQHQWSLAPDGSFQCEFIGHVELANFRGHAKGKLVVRQVEEPNRTVIVRHSLFDCFTDGQQNRFFTKPMRHFLWTVIDRPPLFENQSRGDTISRIRTCSVSMPRLDVGDRDDPTREAAIEEAVVMCKQILTQHNEHAQDVVDNMLLGGVPARGGKDLGCQAPFQAFMTKGVC